MAIVFRLILAGGVPSSRVAEVVAPQAVETRTTSVRPMLRSGPDATLGYGIDIIAGYRGYYDAEDDDGSVWVWEPDVYLQVDYVMRKDVIAERGVPAMLRSVSELLDRQPEDAALVLNANWLLLTRVDGVLRRHRTSWWQHHGEGV
ncbi:SitI3 family protein [Micromonospora sp. NPDC000207]|uniref:SitI3 family protein n=1 Tax=Micromonospora sp. NPDC000207 TaxID=3154246 RepID=UPI0033237FE5